MNLDSARVLVAAQYAAPYEGNFVASLKALRDRLRKERGAVCAFLFPKAMAAQPWASEFMEENRVFLSGDAGSLISRDEAAEVVGEFRPDLVHTHFEGYDVPLSKAVRRSGRNTRVVWHMHDALGYHSNPMKALYQRYAFFRHYGMPFISTSGGGRLRPCLIGVCGHEPDFVRGFRLGITTQETVIPNGIDISRIDPSARRGHERFTFLAYAGRNVQKRVDLLLLASESMIRKGAEIRAVIVDGHAPSVAETVFGTVPEWVTVIPPREDINSVLSLADCFVSTSVHETFSYAIAEAALFGLPVVQSDIEGTMWNASSPSAFLFRSEDTADLERAMSRVMAMDPDGLSAACRATRDRVIRDYSLESWARKVTDFFEAIP